MFNPGNDFEELRFILNSKMRSKLIMILFYNKETLENLRGLLFKPSSTILHALHELTLLNLIVKDGKAYKLTSRGYICALIMYKFISNLYFINKNRNFIENHSLSSIPTFLLKDLYLISNGNYILSEDVDLSKPLEEYLGIIKDSNDLSIILPIFSQIHIDAIMKNIKEGNNKLTLITTSTILKSLKKSGYMRNLSKLSKSNNVSVYRYDGDLDIFLSFGKSFLTFSLFFNDGQFDDSQLFVDKSNNGIKWANNLFDYYIKKSLKIL